MKLIFILCIFVVIFGFICDGFPIHVRKWLEECLKDNKGTQREHLCAVSNICIKIIRFSSLSMESSKNFLNLFWTFTFQQWAIELVMLH